MNATPSIPIACELSPDEQRRHAEAYRSGLFSHVDEVRERRGGYSLRFPWKPEIVRELGEFVAVDSSCCSFLDHGVEVPRGKQVVWLHLTGPDEAQGALKQEIDALVPAQHR